MFTLDTFTVVALQQRYGITGLAIGTHPKHTFSHLDERRQLVTVARPVLRFAFGNARVEKLLPMALKHTWLEGDAGIATRRVYAECEWGADDIEAYVRKTVADLRDNQLVKGASHEVHRALP